ncbi:urea ABC transporter substrate-binding protein [Sphingobacterium paludis]|uniref:Amino acid/amide ABC transporter substrate-binding protein (HAAT family) n=1 Tax=Sphingobacterium paludis TaxID=1476465 RepID=A0A4R7D866_9SPHI|nr:urea ABC transporter substrate-binding protein [Sphingobacterium paludis]TDS17180.1 amino acid/amide ABC transporter substrate-binding protein (HAAT family) [Sphingobacterium paludis]
MNFGLESFFKNSAILMGIGVLSFTSCNSGNTGSSSSASDTSANTVKVGVLHSLSGTMAISEVSLRDAVQMAVEEINASGGVLGKQIEPVIVDPASDWDLFAEKSKELLIDKKVSTVFGCWTSVSRKSVLPVFEQNNGLLFYPVQYEGEESSKNVVYTGAVPNQQLIPAAAYLMSPEGGSYKRFYLLGTDYVFPRVANKILKSYLLSNGVPAENIIEEYTPFHHQDYQTIVSKIKKFAIGGKACVLSTINGDSNIPFYKEFANQGLTSATCPVMAFSVAEDELRSMDTEFLVGHLASWNYFQAIDSPRNSDFVANFKKFCADNNLPGGSERVVDDPICWAYTNVYLWAKAAEKAGSFEVDKVRAALLGLSFDSPAGTVTMDTKLNHLAKPALIGEIKPDGQFNIIWKSEGLIQPQPFFDFAVAK